ncbi:nucleotidyltransferase family protein [Eubacterium sp.]|uniref:nucleotidyltransferase family protein n=1 Tax=Eubacterium sp. TaxID=142586 RepID=UPI001DB7CBDB|nr:nucleotidyltransferase family protein [Eubacterium sp.]MBS5620716.1 nucleotidyltransferase family protein [Eubacterium sp.]
MTKEMELILNVTKIKKTEKENDKVNKLLLDTELDWIKIVGTLFFHRIAGYFYYGLSEMQLKKIPRDIRNALIIYKNGLAREQRKKYKEVLEVLKAMNISNVSYAALKGLAFSFSMYPFGIKQSNDFDLMVLEKDLDVLDKCLRERGYIQSYMNGGNFVEATKKEKLIQRMNYHDLVPYVKAIENGQQDEQKLFVELDINFLIDSKKNLIDEDLYTNGMVEKEIKGGTAKTLKFDEHLLFLCIHFFREATNTLWTQGGNDIKLYKLIDINNLILENDKEFDVIKWCEKVNKYSLNQKCYYTMKVLNDFYKNKKYQKCLSILKPEKMDFMNQIYVEGENRIITREKTIYDVIVN